MTTICTGWKHKHEPKILRVDGDPTTQHSHGMCEDCLQEFLGQAGDESRPADYRAYVRSFPLTDPRD